MKVGIYTPYLETMGGGERHVLALATYLVDKGYHVDIFCDDASLKGKLASRLGLKLGKLNFVSNVFQSSFLNRFLTLKRYDIVFFLSDGSIPFLFGKKNWICFLVPFTKVNGRKISNKIKLMFINKVIANSKFTKRFIDREFGVKSEVLYPAVAVEDFKSDKKENIIISVGRFTKAIHNKKQEVLVDVFKKLCQQGLKNWKLLLVGGSEENNGFVNELKEASKGYPIEVITNAKYNELKQYYAQAKIFWLATGFGSNENQNPEKTEHFGIVTVEAMSAGAVPVVINKGGQPEIVNPGENGFLWETEKDLAEKTLKIIDDKELWKKLSVQAREDSRLFNYKAFSKRVDELL